VRRSSQDCNPLLNGKLHHQKSSNKHEFFVAITSLNKIGEGRIGDLTSDILFSVTFKCAMLIVIRKDPRLYWYIVSNNILICIKNRIDLPRPWIEILTPQVVANRTNWSFHVYLDGREKDTGTNTNDIAMTCKKEKNQELKHKSRSIDMGLKSWTLNASLIYEARIQSIKTQCFTTLCKGKKYASECTTQLFSIENSTKGKLTKKCR